MRYVRQTLMVLCGFVTGGFVSPVGAGELTSATLWAEFAKSPHTHSHLPDFSYAGYYCGEKPLPEPKVVANVRDCGAKGDDATDDTAAFKAAIQKAKAAGGGAVLVPAGKYRLTDVLRLDGSGLVLRGEGPGKTILRFERSLQDILGAKGSLWSWNGALVWIEATKESAAHATVGPAIGTAKIVKEAKMGDFVVEVAPADAARLQAAVGQHVLIEWTGGRTLFEHMGGHESFQQWPDGKWGYPHKPAKVDWVVAVTAVAGNRVTLKQPLRLDVRPDWEVAFREIGPRVEETGVEKLTILFPEHVRPGHLKDPGFNGVFIKRGVNCWVRDVTTVQADNGIIVDYGCHNTITNVTVTGSNCHHGLMLRYRAHDNLFTDFRIEAKPDHGVSTEDYSSGNVWRKGVMLHGTFDSHCRMSFDSLRECIELNSDGGPGGSSGSGPFLGRRMVHWGIRLTGGSSEWCFGPAYLPNGAIVGGQGSELFTRDTGLWHMLDGPKGCIVADHGKAPTPSSLYEAQLARRLKGGKPSF